MNSPGSFSMVRRPDSTGRFFFLMTLRRVFFFLFSRGGCSFSFVICGGDNVKKELCLTRNHTSTSSDNDSRSLRTTSTLTLLFRVHLAQSQIVNLLVSERHAVASESRDHVPNELPGCALVRKTGLQFRLQVFAFQARHAAQLATVLNEAQHLIACGCGKPPLEVGLGFLLLLLIALLVKSIQLVPLALLLGFTAVVFFSVPLLLAPLGCSQFCLLLLLRQPLLLGNKSSLLLSLLSEPLLFRGFPVLLL